MKEKKKEEKNCEHECQCSCHGVELKGGIHFAPCCDGECKICGNHIGFGLMKEHLKVCHGKNKK